jgi:hypothetical protein
MRELTQDPGPLVISRQPLGDMVLLEPLRSSGEHALAALISPNGVVLNGFSLSTSPCERPAKHKI